MLKNIIVSAPKMFTNPYASTGYYINLIGGSGTVRLKILKTNGEEYETNMVKGMSFKVPEGFSSVQFMADTAQSLQVWLGTLPLSYTPLESVSVGANALHTELATAYKDEAVELMPFQAGRGKVTLQSDYELIVGGVNVTAQNGIVYPPQSLIEVNLQGALYALTQHPDAKRTTGGRLSYPLAELFNNGIISLECIYAYSEAQDCIIYDDGNYLRRISASDLSSNKTILSNVGEPIRKQSTIIDGVLNVFSPNGANIQLSQITLDTLSIARQDVVIGLGNDCDSGCVNAGKMAVLMGNGQVYFGDVGVDISANVVTPGMSGTKRYVLVANDETIVVLSSTHCIRSVDGGVTWGAEYPTPFTMAPADEAYVDPQTGFMYVSEAESLFRSTDNGASFTNVKTSTGWVRHVHTDGLNVVVVTDDNEIHSSHDGGDTWQGDVLPGLSASASTVFAASNGVTYAAKSGGTTFALSGEVVHGGGVDVRVMAEVN